MLLHAGLGSEIIIQKEKTSLLEKIMDYLICFDSEFLSD
jgi:hypothetical protein